ncbi:glycoside hydrolase superfamily [Alternaria rosae]|uniref:glycoside hydrolase superfamily n=1 Tax=Alternaria rosae TaxID=1187941 RepID=UPI001E8E23C9|nr:glycoside hydrolase superfamily [Alternaria rosae]KAH6853033.1 glycoside hydrolase superfamily [Alternaria rosae]
MYAKPKAQQPWSLRRKILLAVGILILILALGLGLGLGLTLGRDNDDNDNTSPPASTLTPLPTPNTTIPWKPSVSDTWQIILSHPPDLSSSDTSTTPNVSIFDIDLFDTPTETINQLHSMGKKVICYFSAGSYEDWRPDASEFKKEDLGRDLDGWPGEKWLDLGSENVRRIMKKRIDLAKEKECDGVDPDNVDGYQNNNGLSLTQSSSISYISYLSALTTPLNLTLGLKNAGDIIPAVLPIVHFSVNEQCAKYGECATFAPFIAAGKPVFHIEYPDGAGAEQGLKEDIVGRYCGRTGKGDGSEGFSTVLKKMELDGWVEFCDRRVEVTDVDEGLGNHG